MSNASNSLSVKPIHDRMGGAELEAMEVELAALGISEFALAEDGTVEEIFTDVNEVALDELLERLGPRGAAGDVFLPLRFKKAFEVSGIRCVSAYALLEALDSLRPELGLDAQEDERDPRFARQRNLWKRFRRGAKAAIEERQVLDLVRT